MAEDRTVPSRSVGVPLRAIRVEVVRGMDEGRSFTASGESVTIGTAMDNDVVLGDPTVSRYHLELRRSGDRIAVVDLGSTNGTRVGPALVEKGSVAVSPGTALAIGQTTIRIDDGGFVLLEMHGAGGLRSLRGRSAVMRRLMASVERVAGSEAPVLLVGETGTGKELVARVVHELGARAGGPFVVLDCGATPPGRMEAELGDALERAHGGTLHLAEVGELPVAQQASLQAVLERGRLRRAGGDAIVDVRPISATTRDLRWDVNAGTFRLDLYYRLAVVVLAVPALRERAEDVPLLVEHFLRLDGWEGPVDTLFGQAALESLVAHRWPGNVRELRNVVAAAMALGEAPALAPETSAPDGEAPIRMPTSSTYRDARGEVLREFERRWLARLMEKAKGNVRAAAREAKMDRSYLIDLLERHGLKKDPPR